MRICLSLMAPVAFASALLATTSAMAQDSGYYNRDVSYQGNTEEVEVYADRHHAEHSSINGAPIEDVALSRAVRFDDLDLRSDADVRILQERIRATARTLCRQLDVTHPIATEDSPPCYETAVSDAMAQADNAIDAARRY
ncbi:MAG TPA: UrcA family protein [Rhizomicrobium sp.]|jgi:UrcA family protein